LVFICVKLVYAHTAEMHLKHDSQHHFIFSIMSFPKSIKHTAFSSRVLDALCTMFKALIDARIKIVEFYRKHTTFTFPTSDWVAQLFKNNMFVPFTRMEASCALKCSVKASMFVDASYLYSISHELFFMSF